MAIAPLLDTETAGRSGDLFGAPWPRPALQLVGEPHEVDAARLAPVVPCTAGSPGLRSGPDVARRRARRALARRRRRAVVLTAASAGIVCGLALPFAALGGSPVAADPHAPGGASGAAVYVVRPGDTLWSIAARFERGRDPRPLAEALAKETGSAVVVPGEHLTIP